MNIIEGGITSAKGFKAAAVEAGIKYEGRMDMAMIYSEKPCRVAGTFTQNVVKAAPVIWDKEIVDGNANVHAIVVNSGIANACTGEEGRKYCRETAEAVSKLLSIESNQVLVASTGVIGMQLKMDRLKSGIEKLVPLLSDSAEAGKDASKAIMTTDTQPKCATVTVEIGGKTVTIGGMCKGSGMIHPNMCTMLCFVTTDAAISREILQTAVSEDIDNTFNMVSVDGDTSTNDTYLILANGEAGNSEINTMDEDYLRFKEALHYVNESLAKQIAADGEGATALFTAHVINADTKADAKVLAKSVITSSLTKAAIFGHDANWGRVLCALGYSGVYFDPEAIKLYFESAAGKILIFSEGKGAPYSEEEATRILSEKEVTVTVDMNMGDKEAVAWGCDLSYDYVKINADYRT